MILAVKFDLSQMGLIALSLPASFIVMMGREWFISRVTQKTGLMAASSDHKEPNVLLNTDLWAFSLLCFFGVSWGGIVSDRKKHNFLIFVIGQLWLIIAIAVSLVFLHAKNLLPTDYMYFLFVDIIKKSWLLHLLNYIPIPPFDLSFFYISNSDILKKVTLALKIVLTVVIVLFPIHNSFITGESFLRWVGL